MADLTQNEKELLAVVKFFNTNVKKIDRMVIKLVNNLGVESTALLTGYTENTVKAIVEDFKLESAKRSRKVVAKAFIRSAKERAIAEADANPITEMVDEELAKQQGETRLVIHIDANSDTSNRIAYDIAKAIEKDPVKPGTPFWKGKELAERFGSHRGVASTVRRILIDHNWIAPVDESNPRLGYVVK